jgi:hypothetical protein
LKSLVRVLKHERYSTLLLLVLFIFNSAVFFKISARDYTPSAGASNIYTIVDEDLSPLGTSMNGGIIGGFINQAMTSGIIGSKLYSEQMSDCKDAGSECQSLGDLQAVNLLMDKNINEFSSVNALASLNSTLLEQRPASAVDYVQTKIYALTNLNTVSAQAAPDTVVDTRESYYSPGGTGFNLLKPIQNFWSWSVRVVYGFLLIIVIIIAFAIMFRQRLSGSVEVTIQNAIPSIALAMILVPLSYAISGVFIDIITVGTNAVHSFLIGTPGSPGNSLYNASGSRTYTDPLGNEYPDRGYYPDDIRVDWLRARDNLNVSATFGAIAEDVGQVSGLNGNVIFLAVGNIVNAITGKANDGADAASFTWVGDIVQFFISIITLWIGLQVFWALFKKYITIILYPIVSPFIFATVAIPGNGTKSIMQYAKVMLAAALAYIVTYAMFLLSIIFTSPEFVADVPTFASASFNPPLIGLKSIGIGSNELTQLLLTLIGLGIYFSIPSTLKSIDDALGANNPLPKFLTTPIDSFNESRKVMFKTAPAIAARLGKSGVALTRNTLSAPTRTFSAARDLGDRLRGRTPGDVGTARYNQRQRLAGAFAEYKKSYEEAMAKGDYAGAALAKSRMASVNALGSMYGTGVGTPAELKDKEPKLNAKFTWKKNGAPENTILFTKDEVLKYLAAGTLFNLDLGELEFEAENFALPVGGILDLGELGAASRLDEVEFKPLGYPLEGSTPATTSPAIIAGRPDIFDMGTVAPGGTPVGALLEAVIDNGSSLRTNTTDLTPDSANKKYKVKVVLKVLNLGQFFGVITAPPAGAAGAQPIISGGAISGNKDFKTKPRLFKVRQNGAETGKPLSITIKIQ